MRNKHKNKHKNKDKDISKLIHESDVRANRICILPNCNKTKTFSKSMTGKTTTYLNEEGDPFSVAYPVKRHESGLCYFHLSEKEELNRGSYPLHRNRNRSPSMLIK